nr:hypothetical protein [Tanacetum cinerariifolium]
MAVQSLSVGLNHKPFVPSSEINPVKSRPRDVKNRPKSVKIKVQSSGSTFAGAGAILKRLCNSKMVGKGRSLSDISPMEDCHGKRSNSNSVPVAEVLSKVLDGIAYNKNISDEMVFKEEVNEDGMVNKEGVCEGIVDPLLVSNDTSKLSMADVEHVEDEFIRKTNKDRIDDVNGNSAFVFGDI